MANTPDVIWPCVAGATIKNDLTVIQPMGLQPRLNPTASGNSSGGQYGGTVSGVGSWILGQRGFLDPTRVQEVSDLLSFTVYGNSGTPPGSGLSNMYRANPPTY